MNIGSVLGGNYRVGTAQADRVMLGAAILWTNKAPAGSQTFTASGSFTVPQGYTEVTICMCGGGGSGGVAGKGTSAGGGGAGAIISQLVTGLTTGQEITVTIGAGAAAQTADNQQNGYAGTASSFNGISATGGAAGIGASSTYGGNGGVKVSCGGTFNDGSAYSLGSGNYAYGGQAGAFGNGGYYPAGNGTPGGIGAGGGSGSGTYNSGAGGNGQCVVSWS